MFASRFYSITIRNDTTNPAYFKLTAYDTTGGAIAVDSGKSISVHDLRFNYSGTADTQYALLAHVVSDDIYNGTNHYNKIISTHSAVNNTVRFAQNVVGSSGNGKSASSNIANATVDETFTGGLNAGLDYRDISFTGEVFTRAAANSALADDTKAFTGHTVMSSSIVFGGDPNAVSFNRKIVKKSSMNDFVSSESTHVGIRVHANQNTNTISEFAMWGSELSGDQIKAVWELSRFNDVLFTVQKPMAEALSRMNASFEDGVDKGHRHATKGFVFGNSEHGTDSIVYGGLKK